MADPAIPLGQSTGATLGALPAMPPAPNVLSFLPRERAVQQQIQALPSPALPKLQPVPQNVPPPQVTDPIKAMTPGMMILMALAGATTRHGMTGAVNNLTGYLTGIRQGDEQATKYAMDQFNKHFDAAIASNKSAIEEYHAAREKHGDDVQKLYDEMNGIATEKGDTILQDQLRRGRFDEAFKILDARQRQADALQHQVDDFKLKMAMLGAKPVNPASAAFAAFMKNGYAATSTLEIATRARVSKRELYATVGNKQEMLIACISERARRLQVPTDLPQPHDRLANAVMSP